MTLPLGIFGLDIGELVEDAIRALVDLVVPDFGAQWVSSLVTWLVALPPVTGDAFPSLNRYADQLTSVGFGLLGACFLAGLLQLWSGAAAGGEAVRRAAIGAGALAMYTTVLQSLLVGVNVLTAEMIRHPLVVDGLDKAFGESLTVAAVTGGVTLGLAIAAAVVVLYFVAALFVLKIGLTAILAVAVVGGALVWGLYPLPQAQWLARAWLSGLVAALAVPIAWACIFAAAALLGRDTLVFDGGGQFNHPLGEALGYLVKPFAAVACFWIAYRAPYFLLGIARTAGLGAAVFRTGNSGGGASSGASGSRGPRTAGERFRAFFVTSGRRPAAGSTRTTASRPSSAGARGSQHRRATVTPREGGGSARSQTAAPASAAGGKRSARPSDGAQSRGPAKPPRRRDPAPRRTQPSDTPATPGPKPPRPRASRPTPPRPASRRSSTTAKTPRPGRSTPTRSTPLRPTARSSTAGSGPRAKDAPARPKPAPPRDAKPPNHREPPRRPS